MITSWRFAVLNALFAGGVYAVGLGLGVLVGVAACSSSAPIAASSSCAALLVAIGESRDVEPLRAETDRQIVVEVCARYTGSSSSTEAP